jgi:hypothetical protein
MQPTRVIRFSIALAALAAAPSLRAQSPEEEVLAVVDQLMASMREADTATASSLFLPEARLVAVDSREGHREVRALGFEDFVAAVGQSGGNWNERVWDPEVLFDGDLALVWAKYDFINDGRFSHCGIDAFHLARTRQGWRFISIIYSRRTAGCESPPGG